MSKLAIQLELKELQREKEVLSYKQFWTGKDYARNREITDRIYQYQLLLSKKD